MALSTETNAYSQRAEFFTQIPTSINNYIMVAGTQQTVSIANLSDANGVKPLYLSFAATGSFYVKWNGTAAAASSITNGTGQELNPAQRLLDSSITSFSMIATADCVITLSIFSKIS